MIRLYFVFLFFSFATFAHGQTSEIDSLKSVLHAATEDKFKIDLLNRISKLYQYHSLTDLEHYANEALDLANAIGYDKGRADALTLLGIYNTYRGYHDLALEQQFQSLQIYEHLKDKQSQAGALHNTGGLYFYLREYDKAIEFLLRSVALKKELADTLGVGVSDMSICACYNFRDQPEKGKPYCEEALGIMEHYNKPKRLAEAHLYLAQNLTLRKQYVDARRAYQQTIVLVENEHLESTGVELYTDLGSYYLELKTYDSAAYYLHKTLGLLKRYDDQSSLIKSYELLSRKHELTHRHDSALYYLKLHSSVNNENFTVQKSRQIASLQAQYDLKNKDKELELNRQRLKNQDYIIVAISVILFISVVLGYIIFRTYLAKKKANENLQLLYNTIREKNEKITAQSDELQLANDEITRINENLESIVHERTAKVAVQNKKLIEFAYFNAHQVRGPLARILGLIRLTRLEQLQGEIRDIHDRLEVSAQELDEVIHEINSKLEADSSFKTIS